MLHFLHSSRVPTLFQLAPTAHPHRNRLLLLLLFVPIWSHAAGGLVLTNDSCRYIVLNSSAGQTVVRLEEGQHPAIGDRLRGSFDKGEYASLANKETGEQLRVWVDRIDLQNNHGLARQSSLCR